MKARFAVLSLILVLGLIVAGCGGSDDKESSSGGAGTSEQPADTGGGAAAGGGKAVEVGMEGIEFQPADVTVAVGGTVTWTNNESIPHDVTKGDGPGPDFSSGRGNMMEGDTFEQTFDDAGKIDYVCTVHPNMTGTVTVE